MISAICTLYEGHYHHGVAALSNSLYKNGFRGSIYVGYRGKLPPWALKADDNKQLNWQEGKTLFAAEGLELHFLPLVTDHHLTNYKPDFMLQLWNGTARDAEAMFYFDPDIVVVAPWTDYEIWIHCGVALCEDVNSPLQEFHPQRCAWRNFYEKYGFKLNFKNSIYVNGGFVGVERKDETYLILWKKFQECMAEEIGGLNRSAFKNSVQLTADMFSNFAPFGKTDQDAMNATIEAYSGNISYMGKNAMGFEYGQILLPHALGHLKPWLINPLINWLKGISLRIVDKEFWNATDYPIQIYSSTKIRKMHFQLKVVAFVSRFYSK